MLEVKQIHDGIFKCNWCNKAFNIKDALVHKGNQYFCSIECILKYSELWDHNERIRKGG